MQEVGAGSAAGGGEVWTRDPPESPVQIPGLHARGHGDAEGAVHRRHPWVPTREST